MEDLEKIDNYCPGDKKEDYLDFVDEDDAAD